MVPMRIMVPPAVKAAIEDLARELGRSWSWVSREAMIRGLDVLGAPGRDAAYEPSSAERETGEVESE